MPCRGPERRGRGEEPWRDHVFCCSLKKVPRVTRGDSNQSMVNYDDFRGDFDNNFNNFKGLFCN